MLEALRLALRIHISKSFDFTRELPPLSFSPKYTSVTAAGGAGVVASLSSPASFLFYQISLPLRQSLYLVAAATTQAVVTSITAACRRGVQSMSYVAFTAEHDQNVMPCNRGGYFI
ncbi:unnamed protein product [Cercopithifilaria johnstoni]|uniref:Uncharacterized protein n=1 Tax=Cercopithifilaria johnstoni TaxID=2874296 RepID=A0A8J2PPT7_9BILA|nr:unnamed protein product [Cercopithifilaria johnstoni]